MPASGYFAHESSYIDDGAVIGNGTKIICGVTLGEYAFIGAGAVVTADVPPYGLMVGVPARRVGWMCQCGERLHPSGGRGSCALCGATYEESSGTLRQTKPSRAKAGAS